MADTAKALRIKANMIRLGETIAAYSECDLMDVAAAELDTLRKRVAELEAGWMPIETAPEGRCQMWVADSGQRGMGQVVFGTVFVWPDSRSYRPDGHHGDWNVTHWRPIPVPPPLSAQEKE